MLSFILLLIILALVAHINRERIRAWYCIRTGKFTVFRTYFPDGRYADFVTYTEHDRLRLIRELQDSQRTGEPFSLAGAVVRFELIDGKNHDGRWMG